MPKKAEVAQNQPVAKKPRKPYPTHEERVAAADQTIARLTALNAAREARIAQTEADLEARRAALEKSQAALEKARAKKEHLLALMNRPPKQAKAKLTAEERAAHRREGAARARAAKKAEKEKYDQLLAALAESGKTVEEVLEALKP
ncbi:hypothetical protein [Bilophila wadsworthia]|uniref:hypothetical protein n=1 Tax=Bilophila wadsworthia TaxID=35833 RepID=UPI003A875CAC